MKESLKALLHIGVDADKAKGTLPAITKSLLDILATPTGDDVKKTAINALTKAFAVENVSVSNCHFQG